MKRIFIVCVTCITFYLVSPTFVHGEKMPIEKSEGLLAGTLKNVGAELKTTTESIGMVVEEPVHGAGETVKDTVVFTEQTVKRLSEPANSETESSLLKNTKSLLENTVGNTLPVVEKTTEAVTETIRTTSTEVTNTVDSIVNELPEMPVVTPVVEGVKELGKQTTTEVLKTVNLTVDSVVAELPTVPVVTPVVKEVGDTVKETVSAVQPNQVKPVANETEKNSDSIPIDAVVETNETVSKEPQNDSGTMSMESDKSYQRQINATRIILVEETTDLIKQEDPVMEEQSGLSDRPNRLPDEAEIVSALPISKATSNPVSMKIVALQLTNYTGGDAVNFQKEVDQKSTLPTEPRQKWKDLSVATITSSMSSIATSPLQISGHNDLGFGVVVDVFLLLISNGRQWMPSDDHAMIQWTHAPPGQPPQQTPFLNVKQTL
ncbi:hypothetical protein MKZ26_18665 [Sporosarcina sp. FSL K6-6792]|uniref:hypothetical protein n=1 Tax=Sporosarcina sp. FSL K6-6792 TaxID=2921559 RepID=UPI0030FAE8AB